MLESINSGVQCCKKNDISAKLNNLEKSVPILKDLKVIGPSLCAW